MSQNIRQVVCMTCDHINEFDLMQPYDAFICKKCNTKHKYDFLFRAGVCDQCSVCQQWFMGKNILYHCCSTTCLRRCQHGLVSLNEIAEILNVPLRRAQYWYRKGMGPRVAEQHSHRSYYLFWKQDWIDWFASEDCKKWKYIIKRWVDNHQLIAGLEIKNAESVIRQVRKLMETKNHADSNIVN